MNQSKINVPPEQQATPPPIPPHDNGWTMHAINNLTASVGRLEQSATNIEKTLDKLDSHLEKIEGKIDRSEEKLEQRIGKSEEKISRIEKTIYAATLIVVIFISIGSFVANKAIDFGLDMAKEAIKTQQQDSSNKK